MTAAPTARVSAAAAALGLDIDIRSRPDAASLDEAAAALGISPGDIVKTLVVKRSDDTYLFALIPGDRSISWPKLRAVVGVNRLQLPDPDTALAATGYERGTIVPLGSSTDWPVFADASIAGRRIAMGAGAHVCGRERPHRRPRRDRRRHQPLRPALIAARSDGASRRFSRSSTAPPAARRPPRRPRPRRRR